MLLLADVFEKFIRGSLKFYKIDSSHYFSSPGSSWDVMLKMAGIKLELISDIDKHLFIEKELRRGISYICKRFNIANNKDMNSYDPAKESKFIMYLDENNLYGWGMSQYLPYCEFKWLKFFDKFDVNSISENSSRGYILEVDLEYSDELHYLQNDYPLPSEKLAISYDTLSNYCKKIADKYGIKVGDVKKLVPNLGNKSNYILHYRNLHLHLLLGIKLTKIRKILKFKQSDWLKRYIDFNFEKRKNAAISFEKDFFKLMINSVYDKAMENLRKRINVRIVNNEKDYLKHVNKPTFISQKIFDKNFAAIYEIKPVLTMNKPVYVALTVLKLSKWLM